jgi:hypothetical protein
MSIFSGLAQTTRSLWFRDTQESPLFINETAVRIRAGMLLAIPLYMLWLLIDIVWGEKWIPTGMVTDTFETDWEGRTIYAIEAVRRTYEYSFETALLFYALFEMMAGMTVATSRLSPTIWLSAFLARRHPQVWKPLVPKRFAWALGASMIVACLVFFNPDTFAALLNLVGLSLSTDTQIMPMWVPMLIFACLGFMWMEAILGFCVGCQIHALLVKLRILDEPCESCNNIDWDEIRRKNEARLKAEALASGPKAE